MYKRKGSRVVWKQNVRKMYYGFTGKFGKKQGRAVPRPACHDLPNFCRLRYPFRCSAYYVPLNSFSLLESIWLR